MGILGLGGCFTTQIVENKTPDSPDEEILSNSVRLVSESQTFLRKRAGSKNRCPREILIKKLILEGKAGNCSARSSCCWQVLFHKYNSPNDPMKSELVQAAKILSGAIIAAAGVLGAAIAKIDFAIFVGLVASCVGLGLLIVGWGNFSVRFPQIQTFPLAANARPQEIKPNGASGSLGKEA